MQNFVIFKISSELMVFINGLYKEINHIIRVTLQFCKGEIGRQHIEGASGCRFSPYVISPQPTQTNVHKDQTITPGTPRPTLCDLSVAINSNAEM